MDILSIQKKLKLDKSTHRLILDIPNELKGILENYGSDDQYRSEKDGIYDFVLIFSKTQEELEKTILRIKNASKWDSVFWVSYPKLSGAISSNMKRETIWKAFELIGLEAVTQISLDNTWSALRARPINR